MFKNSALLVMAMVFAVLPLNAQLTIDGTPIVYDKLTKTYLLTAPESVFGSAYLAAVVIDDGVTNVSINGQQVTDSVNFPLVDGETGYTLQFKNKNKVTTSTLYFTYLPIMCLTGTFTNDYTVAPVDFIMPDGNGVQHYRAKIKRAGSSTNAQWIYKRNFHVKFVDDNDEKTDVSFFGLRSDNHWRLDAGSRDMIRFRNYAANGLWADFDSKPYYADKQPKARSCIRGSHVEVFMNGNYHGFYNFSEYLDRKQMKLKKYSEEEVLADDSVTTFTSQQIHGLMWKSKDSTVQTLFVSCGQDPVDNTAPSWGEWELEYPEIDEVCPTDYSVLYNAVKFVSRSNDAVFRAEAPSYFDLPVLADYYMFINVVFGIDNTASNMVLACYDSEKDKKITFAVWDLDATVGQHYLDIDGYYHADEIQPENELEDVPTNMCDLSLNRLFMRVKTLPEFQRRVVNRYWQLRETILDPDSLVDRYQRIYDRLDACGALDRESQRWSGIDEIEHRDLVFDEEMDYLCDWLRRRIAYLDTHTFACMRGDTNGDGMVTITDVTTLIQYLLNESDSAGFNHINADVNADNDITVTDATMLLTSLLGQ